ncbi:primosomal protein N' [Vespertiliibacter pulmonis]|uniref:Replication restart protein PriA n=1 Tax=Vespertiliibacter pulmonis TaxID=1443036 RepID=A0A3N4VV14_9PAST|nr:primosomal protein N' [Vespertiliibacter pulmonis]QLB21091.1 primosomal protein N' [Vespertiliibacter pulmonis]RPE83809.1 replication restart DNA helicase PriA [Vespertiliibacter pulmonis]
MNFVRVALPVPLARYFDYILPEGVQAEKGVRVSVPFGKQHKIGIVIDLTSTSDIPAEKLKEVKAVLDDRSIFDDEMWQLLEWASHYYHAPFGEVLHSALPVKLRQGASCERSVPLRFQITEQGKNALASGQLKGAKKQQALLSDLSQLDTFFDKVTACSPTVWKGLIDKGYIVGIEQNFVVQPWQEKLVDKPICNTQNRLVLNKQQSLVVSRLNCESHFEAFLLNGVTGSGKTEVYLQVIEQVLERNQQVLVLVPEIGLTPQTIQRFNARFNVEIDVLHSNLNDSERLNVWLRAKNGESAIVIGTRSALFTQFHQLGLIIIDEEHDNSFKQQDGWRYHARDLAVLRAKNRDIPIILGSATPSLESLHNAQKGKFTALELTTRAGNAHFAEQQIIDLKTQRVYAGLSEKLLAMMKAHLEKGNQVMLFLNRRGFAPVLLCHECGWICQCDSCEKPFTYYQKKQVLRCNHCASQHLVPRQCGHCGSTNLITTGIGTEQLEQVLIERFPQYKVSRIDSDSTAKKGSLEQHLNEIQSGKSQILIGTQMLAKGHHFPNVTLVAIINVDASLFSTDFRAEEHLAQLYVQVSGRAGRGGQRSEVVLQTHYPDHLLLKSLLTEGYASFAEQALKMRQLMGLPPYTAQVLFRATGRENEKVENFLQQLTACLNNFIEQYQWQGFQLLGPINAPMAKKAGHFRWQLLIQHSSRGALKQLLDCFDAIKDQFLRNDIRLTLDVDPQDLS